MTLTKRKSVPPLKVAILFAFRVMIHVVAQCHEEGLEHYLRSYVKVHLHISWCSVAVYWVMISIFTEHVLISLCLRLNRSPPAPRGRCMRSWLKPWPPSWSPPPTSSQATNCSRSNISKIISQTLGEKKNTSYGSLFGLCLFYSTPGISLKL